MSVADVQNAAHFCMPLWCEPSHGLLCANALMMKDLKAKLLATAVRVFAPRVPPQVSEQCDGTPLTRPLEYAFMT